MSNSAEFLKAEADVRNLKEEPTNEQRYKLYGLYQQATIGDINTERPGMTEHDEKAQWDSWASYKGMDKEDAEKQYIEHANLLISVYGLK